MTDKQQQPLASDVIRHRNRGLFSDYYLNEIIPDMPEWAASFADAKALRDDLRALLAQIQPEKLEESQLEAQWIQPILEKLGHHYGVQVKFRYRDKGYRQPDYILAPTAERAQAITKQIYQPHELADTLAVMDAKAWGTKLDQSSAKDRNPSQQIDEYLRYSELPWGILTDGRYWRLYERHSSKNNVFYAVDLLALLEQRDADSFRYFYLFFSQAAFTSNWLGKVLKGSEEFAQRVSDELELQVYDALELIAQGFLDYRRNRLTATPAHLKEIYENSLIFLYRLLFVFYSESRGILPLHQNLTYTERYSLDRIKRDCATERDFPKRLSSDSGEYYTRLNDLFFMIDAGSPEFEMPAYNGRLFSEEAYPFLAQNLIGDTTFVPAIDKLARIEVPNGRTSKRVFVDYRDLEERHLGAIYEKLLDYELDVASEALTTKNGLYAAAKGNDAIIKAAGRVYLRTGNHERRITGSYYTPSYIVRFIVEQTLEPLLTRITQHYAQLNEEGLWIYSPDKAADLRQAILRLNILDPAIGSGHFLVDAVAYVAEWLRGLKLPVDLVHENESDELIYWKRQVAAACIYAVDINPLAVELAKLSLWLATLSQGKPLSFLDHHIRVGNSLVGARLTELQNDLPSLSPRNAENVPSAQLRLFDDNDALLGQAVRDIYQIETTIAEHVRDVKAQEASYARMVTALRHWQQLADVWTARHFGLALSQTVWDKLRDFLLKGGSSSPEIDDLLAQTATLAAQFRFFHWDVAFPEAFYDDSGAVLSNPGFDAVIGNPPYVRQERFSPIKPYLERHYAIYQGTADLFLYFYERGLALLKDSADERLGFITSGTFMNTNSASRFREFVHQNAAFLAAFNFGENQPFRGAEMVYPSIAILKRGAAPQTFPSYFMTAAHPYSQLAEAFDQTLAAGPAQTLATVTASPEWRFQDAALTALFQKIIQGQPTLDEAVNGRIYRGVTTGLNEAFIVDGATRQRLIAEHPSSAEIIKPMLRGQDLRPWYQEENNLFLIRTQIGIDIDKYPAVLKHLERLQERLSRRYEPANGQCAWYELRPCSYYHEFETSKIIWADIGKIPRFSWNEHSYLANTAFMIGGAKWWMLSILQSRVSWFALSQIASPLRLRAGLWQYRAIIQYVERLPIPQLNPAQEADLSALAEELTALASARYALHEALRHRLRQDLGGGARLNQALEAWWELDPNTLREAVNAAFRRDIPLRDRGEWEAYLKEQQAEHQRLTAQIVALETRLNTLVYAAFKLDESEIALIEKATQYPYGAV